MGSENQKPSRFKEMNPNSLRDENTENQKSRTKEKHHLLTIHRKDSSDLYNTKVDCNVKSQSVDCYEEYIYSHICIHTCIQCMYI